MARKTFQTVQLPGPNGGWQVFCVETGKEVAVCSHKERAVALVTQLNNRSKSEAA